MILVTTSISFEDAKGAIAAKRLITISRKETGTMQMQRTEQGAQVNIVPLAASGVMFGTEVTFKGEEVAVVTTLSDKLSKELATECERAEKARAAQESGIHLPDDEIIRNGNIVSGDFKKNGPQ